MDPNETDGITRIPSANGESTYCRDCSAGDDLDSNPNITRNQIKGRLVNLRADSAQLGERAVSPQDIEDAAKGPYLVSELSPSRYLVKHPDQERPRSALSDRNHAIQMAARFNREVAAT